MRKLLIVVASLALIFGAGMAGFEAQAMKCYTYHNSQVTDLGPEWGFACAGTGNGCAECYDEIVVTP